MLHNADDLADCLEDFKIRMTLNSPKLTNDRIHDSYCLESLTCMTSALYAKQNNQEEIFFGKKTTTTTATSFWCHFYLYL